MRGALLAGSTPRLTPSEEGDWRGCGGGVCAGAATALRQTPRARCAGACTFYKSKEQEEGIEIMLR